MQQDLQAGESTSFQLGTQDYAIVTNSTVIIDGVASVAGSATKFGPYAAGANVRVIGLPGGGVCSLVDKTYDDRAVVFRDSNGVIAGLVDPNGGQIIAFGGSSGAVVQNSLTPPSSALAPSVDSVVAGLLLRATQAAFDALADRVAALEAGGSTPGVPSTGSVSLLGAGALYLTGAGLVNLI